MDENGTSTFNPHSDCAACFQPRATNNRGGVRFCNLCSAIANDVANKLREQDKAVNFARIALVMREGEAAYYTKVERLASAIS